MQIEAVIKVARKVGDKQFNPGDVVMCSAEEFATLYTEGTACTRSEWTTQQSVVRAREASVDNAIRASKAFAPKEDTSKVRDRALKLETAEPGAGVEYIQSLPAREEPANRLTAHQADGTTTQVEVVDQGLRETIKGYLKAHEDDYKLTRDSGGVVKASRGNVAELERGVVRARVKASLASDIARMLATGGDVRLDENLVKAADYNDAAGALGTLNTGLVLQWNLGHLENQLIMLSDITTDVSNTPVLFQQQALTRYIKVPGVQLKTSTTAWSGSTGNDVNVNVLMDQYAGVPLTVNNMLMAATARQLLAEQKTPQLYGLGEYILYKLIYNIINGNSRIANDGTVSTIKFNPNFTDPALGAGVFNIANATLKTFTADLPTAMDLAKFPGGDEEADAEDLMRFAWVHSTIHGAIAGNESLILNQSIQGIAQRKSDNVMRTGRVTHLGSLKLHKSQLMSDQITTTGSGADGGTNAMFVSPGDYTKASTLGFGGTRSALLFVSRAPLDYVKAMPEVPSTAAIELATTPKLGITVMVVKYIDHGYENANMRVAAMFGTGIGDERQGMPLRVK